ncbi:MAG: hypothetical protein ACK514_15180 [Bacteroidota bacterium]|jgi:hypothetical protein|nr:hypothetical protein [Cytophagales bacterium]MCE2958211.1 hypothetical protein [Flammeovirgaceae bacterium]MCZ8071324.1 hypothetical protein [Cytophagales bacterium]
MMSKKVQSYLTGSMLVIILAVVVYLTFDLMFSPPIIMEGVVIEKAFVEKQMAGAPSITPYNRYKSYDYVIQSQKHEQWIAFVKTDDGKVLKVHCTSDHYGQKQVGDKMRFKEYTGGLLGIEYFAHNEEDE